MEVATVSFRNKHVNFVLLAAVFAEAAKRWIQPRSCFEAGGQV